MDTLQIWSMRGLFHIVTESDAIKNDLSNSSAKDHIYLMHIILIQNGNINTYFHSLVRVTL